jgi:hypothetical protein
MTNDRTTKARGRKWRSLGSTVVPNPPLDYSCRGSIGVSIAVWSPTSDNKSWLPPRRDGSQRMSDPRLMNESVWHHCCGATLHFRSTRPRRSFGWSVDIHRESFAWILEVPLESRKRQNQNTWTPPPRRLRATPPCAIDLLGIHLVLFFPSGTYADSQKLFCSIVVIDCSSFSSSFNSACRLCSESKNKNPKTGILLLHGHDTLVYAPMGRTSSFQQRPTTMERRCYFWGRWTLR